MSTEIATTQPAKPRKPLPLFGDLTLRQNSFVDHYLQTGNATEAAKLAGYDADRNNLAVIGSQLLRSLKIKQEIKRRLGKSIATGPEVLERLTLHARGDITDVLNEAGEFDLKRARSRRLLKKLKVKTDKDGSVSHEYEIHDPQAALEKLGRFHKLFTDKVEVEQPQLTAIADSLRELQLTAQSLAQSQSISLYDACVRLADELSDVPELASQLRVWAEAELRSRDQSSSQT